MASSPRHGVLGDETAARPGLRARLRRILFGKPRDLADQSLFHRLSLIPLLAWIGLGSDGLSSSAYGPQEAFRTLGEHRYLAIPLALMIAATVCLISAVYSRIIEEFPQGGGGYVVGTKLLGKHAGLASGCALLVDYVLTIAVSIASAADALFSLLPLEWHWLKLPAVVCTIVGLSILNIRGVRESVVALAPIFLLFVVTHAIAIGVGVLAQPSRIATTARSMSADFSAGLSTFGLGGLLALLAYAYTMGSGTYTGLEAVSNGMPILREPRVQTAKRTMLYMAVSLSFTSVGLILCYLLWGVEHVEGKTMNAVLVENMARAWPSVAILGGLVLLSDAAILIVAAQTGFLGGPRVLAAMTLDSWAPRRFAALCDRLTTRNGILLMGASAVAAILYTSGDVRHLVIMYSINVFLTFSLSMLGMARASLASRRENPRWMRRWILFVSGFLVCASILVVTVIEKFAAGGWVTLAVTGIVVALCLSIRAHYTNMGFKLAKLYATLEPIHTEGSAVSQQLQLEPSKPTAVFLVSNYGGLGVHTVLWVLRTFPGHFKNLVFVSVGVVDSGGIKEKDAVKAISERTERSLKKYLELARSLGVAATYRMTLGTDPVAEAEKLCLEIADEFQQPTFFAGKLVFERPRWYQRLLHNETAFAIERRLQQAGKTVVIVPAKVD